MGVLHIKSALSRRLLHFTVLPQGHEQHRCCDCHSRCRDPAQRVRDAVAHLIFHNALIIADQHNHQEQRRGDDNKNPLLFDIFMDADKLVNREVGGAYMMVKS